jgi:hypothetical protein
VEGPKGQSAASAANKFVLLLYFLDDSAAAGWPGHRLAVVPAACEGGSQMLLEVAQCFSHGLTAAVVSEDCCSMSQITQGLRCQVPDKDTQILQILTDMNAAMTQRRYSQGQVLCVRCF